MEKFRFLEYGHGGAVSLHKDGINMAMVGIAGEFLHYLGFREIPNPANPCY